MRNEEEMKEGFPTHAYPLTVSSPLMSIVFLFHFKQPGFETISRPQTWLNLTGIAMGTGAIIFALGAVRGAGFLKGPDITC